MIAVAAHAPTRHWRHISPATRTLRIALVSTQRSWSGGEAQAHLLAKGLRSRGHEVNAFSRQSSHFADQMATDGFRVHSFFGRGRNPWGAWQLRHSLGLFQPDIIHINDSHALTSVGIALTGQRRPACVVSRRVDFPVRLAHRYRLWCDRVLCVSHAVARVCANSGLPSNRLQIVPDGCDPKRLEHGDRRRGREAMQVAPHEKVLLTVARLSDHKGHSYLLDAMPEVIARYPQTVLALAGEGEQRRPLERQTRTLRLEKHVRFLGHRRDIADVLHGSDIFVMPSHLEGLCSSVIDAMLAGLPTVATTAGGIPDLLGAYPNSQAVGTLVPPRDSSALARGLIDVLSRPDHFVQLARRAQSRARQLFTVDCMVEETIRAYQDLLAEKAPVLAFC
ncbi:MAG: glycosyltransferase family 4 protein [Planctomycetota bacterium]|nr:glycosyltransferase family 4 protein [Planctomycetota bacterium]MDA1177246.1 glycosyltransferase family 4 protein [Planctomycetota bacterium]